MLDSREMHCPDLCQCAKAPHFLYYVPRNIHSPASLKKLTPLPVQLQVQISVASNGIVLNSRFYRSFLFRMATQGVWVILQKLRKTVSKDLNDGKKHKRILCENSIFIGKALAIAKQVHDEQK